MRLVFVHDLSSPHIPVSGVKIERKKSHPEGHWGVKKRVFINSGN